MPSGFRAADLSFDAAFASLALRLYLKVPHELNMKRAGKRVNLQPQMG